MTLRTTIASLTLAAAFLPIVANALTAQEWETLNNKDSSAAADSLMHAFAVAQSKAADHYREKGNTERAEVVQKLNPNVHELLGRVSYVATAQPTADVEDIMRGYIIDASAQIMSKKKRGQN